MLHFKKRVFPVLHIDKIADLDSKFPHMVSSNIVFIEHIKAKDIRNSDQIVINDRIGMFSLPRVWFTFKVVEHNNVRVLNRGFPLWEKANGQFELSDDDYRIKTIERCKESILDCDYYLNEKNILNLNQFIKKSIMIGNGKFDEEIIDTRFEERHLGKAPDPRPSLRVGHAEEAKNLFFKLLLDKN